MSEEEHYMLAEAHEQFAKQTNGQVWGLLGKDDRTAEEDELMEFAAVTSLYHWLEAGTVVHQQRGEWMVAHVYTVLGNGPMAMRHATRCLELTEGNSDQMADFDVAYALEGIARANALNGNEATAKDYLEKARAVGEAIADAESKEFFVGDLAGGEWYGVV
jgi:hypothetical protein